MKKVIFIYVALLFWSSCRTPNSNSSEFNGQIQTKREVDCAKREIHNPQPSRKFIDTRSKKSKVRLLVDNEEAWYVRWHIMSDAKKTIDVQYYIIDNDEYGQSFLGLLLYKQLSGLKVRIMVDGRGSPKYTKPFLGEDILQELVAAGVEVIVYNPIIYSFKKLEKNFEDGIRLTKSLLKGEGANEVAGEFLTLNTAANHDKLIIVDSEYIILGGRNISKQYFEPTSRLKTAYDDLDVLIHSAEAAAIANIAFIKEVANENNTHMDPDVYNFDSHKSNLLKQKQAMDRAMTGKFFALGKEIRIPNANGTTKKAKTEIDALAEQGKVVTVAILDNASAANKSVCKIEFKYRKEEDVQISTSLLWAIENAKSEIWMFNPYVVITTELKKALKIAAAKKVKINLITNSILSTDSLLTQAVFVDEWKYLLRDFPTLRIFVSKGPSKLHGKAFVFDDSQLIVGSYNLDAISQNINSEVVAYIDDAEKAVELRKYFENFIQKNTEELYIKDGVYHGFFELSRFSNEFESRLSKIKTLIPLSRFFRDRI